MENTAPHPVISKNIEHKRFVISLTIPLVMLMIIWIIKTYEVLFDADFYQLGVYPRTLHGLIGILTAPLIHGDFNHIYFNSLYWLIFGTAFFYSSPKRGYIYFLFCYFLPSFLVWCFARPAYHIGLSGVIYALASYLFFVNLMNKDFRMMAVSLAMIFLFSGMIAGLFPKDIHISWESHLAGVMVGLGLSVVEAIKTKQKIQPSIPFSTTYFDKLSQFDSTGTSQKIDFFYNEENDTEK